MALQETGTPPKTKRLGIIPHSIRKKVIVCSVIIFLIMGVLGGVGTMQKWDIVFNLISLILAVASVIVGLLALWPPKESADASTSTSNPPAQQIQQGSDSATINPGNTGGVPPANPPSSSFPAPGPSAQQGDLDDDEINQLAQALIDSPDTVFDNVFRLYKPPSGVARTGSIPHKVDELVNIARIRGDLLKLRNAYYTTIGMPPPPVKKKIRAD